MSAQRLGAERPAKPVRSCALLAVRLKLLDRLSTYSKPGQPQLLHVVVYVHPVAHGQLKFPSVYRLDSRGPGHARDTKRHKHNVPEEVLVNETVYPLGAIINRLTP